MPEKSAQNTGNTGIDTLVIANVATGQLEELRQALVQNSFYFTQVESSGLIPKPTVSLLIGIDGARMEALMELIETCCGKREKFVPTHMVAPLYQGHVVLVEAEVGGAVTYTLPVERFIQL